MRTIRLLAATAALLGAAPAHASAAPADSTLRTEAAPYGLTAAQAERLQVRVDRVVARTGGTQVAINRVVWPGGDTLVPLPGERRARELGSTTDRARPSIYGCRYLQFCTYSSKSYTGVVDRMSSCTLHRSHGWFRSYVNNQTRGTRARLYLGGKRLISWTRPAPATGTTSLGLETYYIRPC